MENTLENKAKFFAQYWGQKLLAVTVNENDYRQKVGNTYMGKYHVEMCHLELKPFYNVSDVELIEVAKQNRFINGKNEKAFINVGRDILHRIFVGEKYDTFPICLPAESADYLRSKGYAIPFFGLSVEKMIEYGWIKLKT